MEAHRDGDLRAEQRAGAHDDAVVAWASVYAAFASELEPHVLIEEQHLLPALAERGHQDLAEKTRADHSALRALLGAEGVDLQDRPNRFGELLAAHVRFEERELFNVAQESLDAAALEAIATAHS